MKIVQLTTETAKQRIITSNNSKNIYWISDDLTDIIQVPTASVLSLISPNHIGLGAFVEVLNE